MMMGGRATSFSKEGAFLLCEPKKRQKHQYFKQIGWLLHLKKTQKPWTLLGKKEKQTFPTPECKSRPWKIRGFLGYEKKIIKFQRGYKGDNFLLSCLI